MAAAESGFRCSRRMVSDATVPALAAFPIGAARRPYGGDCAGVRRPRQSLRRNLAGRTGDISVACIEWPELDARYTVGYPLRYSKGWPAKTPGTCNILVRKEKSRFFAECDFGYFFFSRMWALRDGTNPPEHPPFEAP